MFLLFTILVSLFIGIGLVFRCFNTKIRVTAFVFIFLVSNLLASWSYFGDDPKTWMTTYFSGVVYTGIASLLFHVVPAVLSCYLTIRLMRKANMNDNTGNT